MPSVLGDFPLKRMKSLRRSLTKTSLRIFHVAILEKWGWGIQLTLYRGPLRLQSFSGLAEEIVTNKSNDGPHP